MPMLTTNTLIHCLRTVAEDHEKYEQGGGCSEYLSMAADAIQELLDVLGSVELGTSTSRDTGSDTAACPACGLNSIYGLDPQHEPDCRLAAVLKKYEQDY